MNDLEFRKFLTEYGLTYEEYENMTEDKKKELKKKYKLQNTSNNFKIAGDGMKGCGCILMLLPIAAILIYFIISILTS